MLKILALCAILAFVNSEEQTQDDDTVQVTLVNYSAMYDNECKSTTSAPAQSPGTTCPSIYLYATLYH